MRMCQVCGIHGVGCGLTLCVGELVAVVGGFGVCWLRALFFCVFWWVFYFLVFVCDDFG